MNAQQPQTEFYPGYGGGPLSHSPNSSRPGYATTVGVPSALGGGGGGRRNQQQSVDAVNQAAALFSDDRFASFDAPSQRFERGTTTPSSLQNAFSMFNAPNQTAWGYNGASSAATMNGPIGDGTRIRNSNRRPPLHSEWTANQNEAPLGNQGAPGISYYQQQQHLVGQPMGLPNSGSPDPYSVAPPTVNIQAFGQPDMRSFSDNKKDMGDLIPTAIVIKNIPFNVRKEYLTSVMIEMHLPQPYAFNYHFDNGIFRGLAFANFQNAQDTALVIDRMNGLDIQGRKLRVEYKKMLPEHERERIEREKREKRGQLEEQHRGPAHQVSISSLATTTSLQRAPVNDNPGISGRVDLNDPHTLQFYLDLYMFRNDDNREVHIFPADTAPEDRRMIHILAHNMGLEHTSIGEGENRQVHVSKSKFATGTHQSSAQQPGVTLDGHPRGLSRAATYDFNDRQQHPSVHAVGRGPTLTIPNSPENHQHGGLNSLRGVKSFADLRSFSPSPSPSMVSSGGLAAPSSNGHGGGGGVSFMTHYPNDGPFGPSLTTPTTPGSGLAAPPPQPASNAGDASSLVNGLGSLGLGSSSYDGNGNSLASWSRETPGAIGSQRPSANGNGGNRSIPERQPRGPGSDWENPNGFSRGRSNGHMHRGSDSSDSRLGATHGSAALY
ncbi:r3h domain protein [Grosmannia clavigera kw1407]|uniref:R3h domain protein n=1 Tax=Grosmannia clavigera (strain kw1407 / UAMH 11150) TaxID=655863 RepID=F0X755_GROCL|nr:r3h domain protein [Grosmannia clavigera kw1407]EFX06227.1 r3h domain protein [Grosmannia clavigera kw1407]